MNSDTRQPTLQPSVKVPSERARRIVLSLVLGCCVFGGFTTYAFVSPATYEAKSEVQLIAPEDKPAQLYPIADRRQRLLDAVLRKDSIQRLSEKLGATTPDARLELASRLQGFTTIETTDGRSYRIACRASTAEAARAFCQALSEMVTAELPAAAVRQGLEPAQTERMEALLQFLSSHPQISSATNPQPGASETHRAPGEDPLIRALNAQRQVLQKDLAELQKIDPANPYVGTLSQEITQTKRQLGAIDNAIIKRQQGLKQAIKADPNGKDNPESIDGAAWKQLSALLAELGTTSKPLPADLVRATVSIPAALPESPISPNRVKLMILGALAGLGVSIMGLGLALAARTRESPTSRPQMASAGGDPPVHGPHTAYAHAGYTASVVPHQNDWRAPAAPVGLTVTQSLEDYNARYDHQPAGVEPPNNDPILPDAKTVIAAPIIIEDPDPEAHAYTAEVVVTDKSPRTQLGGFGGTTPARSESYDPGEALHVGGFGGGTSASFESEEPDEPPRTQLGGFAPTLPSERSNRPISTRGVVTVEARVDSTEEAPVDGAPQAKVATGSGAPSRGYVAPKRNITRRLGSLSWLDKSELPQSPASTRYSYVSSRPPPPQEQVEAHAAGVDGAGVDAEWTATPERGDHRQVTDTYGEPQERALATVPRGMNPTAVVTRHPPPVGWKMPGLEALASPQLVEQLIANVGAECCVVGVTSNTELSRAKGMMAASLAVKLADLGGPRVVLMEGNFQEPAVHKLMQIQMPMASGFSQQLQRRLSRTSANLPPWELIQCLENLDVIAEGFIRSPGALLSQHFEQCLNALRLSYDIIILDGPPLGTSSECRAFTDVIDGVVICAAPNGQQIHSLASNLFQDKRFVLVQPTPSR